jgi:hypothetical protein
MRVLWLPTVLRAAGLTVHEVAGWKTRGADSFGPVRGITCHHTAGSRTSSDAGEIGVLVNGRPGLSGPIAQLYLSRTGDWHVVASGHCNHNLVGWAGPNEGYGNDSLLGVEAQHADGEPWTDRQYDSYVRGVAALVRHEASGWDVTVARVAGHKEHQPGAKSDPSFDMTAFRTRVRAEIDGWEDGGMLIRKGDTGEEVKFWQYVLGDVGYSPGEVDGDYGAKTEAAVNAHRKSLGQGALTYISGYHGFALLRAMMDRRAGKPGPAGASGPQGPVGLKGDRGPVGPAGVLSGELAVTGGRLTVEASGANE